MSGRRILARLPVASQGQKGRKQQVAKAPPKDIVGKKALTPASRITNGMKTSQFTLFPQLPPELRELIWLSALPNRRVVTILDSDASEWSWDERAWLKSCKASCNIPAVLITTQESRKAARRRYEQVFAEQLGIPIWFDFAKDVLFFVNREAVSGFHGGIHFPYGTLFGQSTTAAPSLLNKFDMSMLFEKVKHLIIGDTTYWATSLSVLPKFRSLETLTLQRGSEPKALHLESFLVTVKQFLRDEREAHFTDQGMAPSDPEVFILTAHKLGHKIAQLRQGAEITEGSTTGRLPPRRSDRIQEMMSTKKKPWYLTLLC